MATGDGVGVRGELEQDLDGILKGRKGQSSQDDGGGEEKQHEGPAAGYPVPSPLEEVAKLSLYCIRYVFEVVIDRYKTPGAAFHMTQLKLEYISSCMHTQRTADSGPPGKNSL